MVAHDLTRRGLIAGGGGRAARPLVDTSTLAAAWSRIGAGFNTAPAAETPDLEMLIIESVRSGRGNVRLLVATATWLVRYGTLVARHRLRRLAGQHLRGSDRAALGLLLSTVRDATGTAHFSEVIAACTPATSPEPLLAVHADSAVMRSRLERSATELSRQWGVLAEPIVLKPDMLRTPAWVIRENPAFGVRADLDGDLRASILAEMELDPGAGASELELARRCGATRTAIRGALQRLELAGRIDRERIGRRLAVRLVG